MALETVTAYEYMPDPDRNATSASDLRFDNWPVQGRDEYADWDVQRATPRDEGGTREEIAEEYEAEMADEELEWIGYVGQPGVGDPYLYAPHESALYEGELDEDEERVILRESSRRDVEEESLGEHIEEFGEEHGWHWLSSFAREYLEGDDHERSSFEHRNSEFQQRNVAPDDPYDLAFYGSHTFDDASGRVHTLDRFFDVYSDDERSEGIRVEVDEEYLIAEDPQAESRAGDAELVDENERETAVDVDVEEPAGEGRLAERLEEWHEEHVWRQSDR